MRTILPTGLWLVLTLSGFRAAAAQSVGDSVQVATRDELRTLFATYGPAKEFRWYRTDDPFVMQGFLDKGLIHTPRFEVYVTVATRKTIWFRVYPQFSGDYINLDKVTEPQVVMQKLLRDSYRNFFFWGADDNLEVFAGFELTLESGFPEEAIKVVDPEHPADRPICRRVAAIHRVVGRCVTTPGTLASGFPTSLRRRTPLTGAGRSQRFPPGALPLLAASPSCRSSIATFAVHDHPVAAGELPHRRNASLCNRVSYRVLGARGVIHCQIGGCVRASGLLWEGAMITPLIHRVLKREDMTRLVAEIGRLDQAEARAAEEAVQAGDVDAVLDSAAAVEAVRGRGGAPAAVPLTILWYVPVRAALRARGVSDVELADYAATMPVVFATWQAVRSVARGETGISVWWRYVASLPDGTVAQAEGAADVAALALWWAGCFPEWVTRRAAGRGMVRAYVTFAGQALALAARILALRGPVASLCARAAAEAEALYAALAEARRDYLGRDIHSAERRLERFLSRLGRGSATPPTLN